MPVEDFQERIDGLTNGQLLLLRARVNRIVNPPSPGPDEEDEPTRLARLLAALDAERTERGL